MQRVAELTEPPQVGRKYLVLCVAVLRDRRWHQRDGWHWCGPPAWLPVMGALHRDPELGDAAKDPHWHADLRFVGKVLWETMDMPTGPVRLRTTKGEMSREQAAMGRIYGSDRIIGEPEERAMRCVRAMPIFPVAGKTAPVALLEPAYRKRRLPPGCLACPHRGFPLGSLPRIAGRFVVCPGHGLAVDVESGCVVPRAEVERCREVQDATP